MLIIFISYVCAELAKIIDKDNSQKQLVLIGHSKGGVDVTAAVSISIYCFLSYMSWDKIIIPTHTQPLIHAHPHTQLAFLLD